MANTKKKTDAVGDEEMVPVRVPVTIRRRLRLLAAQRDQSLQAVVTALLDEALRKSGV